MQEIFYANDKRYSFFFSRIFFLRIQDHWVLAIENQLIQHAFNTLCLISYLTKQYRWNAQQQLYLHSSPYSLQHFKEKTEIIYSSHRNRELVNLLVSTVTRCMSLVCNHHYYLFFSYNFQISFFTTLVFGLTCLHHRPIQNLDSIF